MGNGASVQTDAFKPAFDDRFAITQYLEKGHYGSVSVCMDKWTETEHAVKVIQTKDKLDKKSVEEERRIWSLLTSHEHVVELYASFSEDQVHYFVMERCQKTLGSIEKERRWQHHEESFLIDLVRQLLLAVSHCHLYDIAHRDIKPANALVGFDGVLRLCDFGVSERVPEDGLRGRAGTAYFMSPEMLHDEVYGVETDIWSVGVTAYVLLFCQKPYTGESLTKEEELKKDKKVRVKQAMKAIADDFPKPAFKAKASIEQPSVRAEDFVKSLMTRDPAARPCAGRCVRLAEMCLKEQSSSTEVPGTSESDTEEILCGSAVRVAAAIKRRQTLVPPAQVSAEAEEKSWQEKESLCSLTTCAGSSIRNSNWTSTPSSQSQWTSAALSSQICPPPGKPEKERRTNRGRSLVPTQR